MGKLAKIKQSHQGAIPPFAFLSDVLLRYGSLEVRFQGNSAQGNLDEGFYSLLARKFNEREIPLFDVHTLKLVSGRELDEVISFLQNPENVNSTRIAFESGRDYCMDWEATMRVLNDISKITSTLSENTGTARIKSVNSYTLVRNSDPKETVYDANWLEENWIDAEIEQFGFERLRLMLAKGREVIERKKINEERLKSTGMGMKPQEQKELKPGVTSQSSEIYSSYANFTGKFNRDGMSALWFDTANIEWPAIGSDGDKKYSMWQTRLNEMYKKTPGKTKTELCKELAANLHAEKRISDKSKKISAATIFRRTKDPGMRKRGGSLPRSQRKTK